MQKGVMTTPMFPISSTLSKCLAVSANGFGYHAFCSFKLLPVSTCGKHGQSKLVKGTTNLCICIKYAEL